MNLIHALFLFCVRENISLSLRHICGFNNLKVDALSPLLIQKFKELHPRAEEHPTPVDPRIWSLLRKNGMHTCNTAWQARLSGHTNLAFAHTLQSLQGRVYPCSPCLKKILNCLCVPWPGAWRFPR